jgi:para-nitrobenzyl esterase
LKWVKNNISAFGGDPNNVTIFGQSSGAGSVAALLGAPLEYTTADDGLPLFHAAMMQSGGFGIWASQPMRVA